MEGTISMSLGLVAALMWTALVAGAGLASAQNILITINKASQKMTVQVDGQQKYVWLVSTGAPGYDTPSGTFKPFRMEADHFSEEWDDAPMPHSIFFTPVGHAIHGSFYTKRLGTRASHGCVRLAPENATTLYAMVEKTGLSHTTVVVKGGGLFDWDAPAVSAPPLVPPKWFKKVKTSKTVRTDETGGVFQSLFGR